MVAFPLPRLQHVATFRRRAAAHVVDLAYENLARVSGLLPVARPEFHGLERRRDLPYRETGLREHTLDVYRPKDAVGPLPVAIYIHGGAFRALSKDTHWLMGLIFGRRGYVCFNLNYRLAPDHRYPAAIEDVCHAYRWVVENAHRYGGDVSRLVVAGESAGANLSAALAVASCWRFEPSWASQVFDTGVVPAAAAPVCGLLQVSDPARFGRRRPLPTWLTDQLEHCSDGYLPASCDELECGLHLADPLRVLEEAGEPERPLPPFFSAVGTKDPLLDDTRRLKTALERRGVETRVCFYPGEMHAFHALVWRKNARECWKNMFRFLDEHV